MLHSYNHEPFYLYSHGVREELPLPLSGIRHGRMDIACGLYLSIPLDELESIIADISVYNENSYDFFEDTVEFPLN